ncbi:MAG: hypothetical protein JWO38_4861 [Gemmataceae bacterium]|nr:hypothetical protein [Gemmataceae bacterium]
MKTTIRDLVVAGRWQDLCATLRDWHTSTCPRLTRDVRELAIGTWVGRMVIRTAQVRVELAAGRTTEARWRSELAGEIDTFLRSEQIQYERYCRRVDAHPPAEALVAETHRFLTAV